MEKNSRSEFSSNLLSWYGRNKRDLPWRKNSDPYSIWVSEVMLQQTTVSAVLPYFNRWMETFPDVRTLSAASLESVLKAWQGLGYYQRARNMHRAAQILVQEFDSCFPREYATLKKLPGFGPYTTAAVLSIAFDLPFPVLDANVRRILMRLKGLKRMASSRYDKILMDFLLPLLPKKDYGDFNQALMELGAMICKPKNPRCLLCPILRYCGAWKKGEQEVIPTPRSRRYKKIEAVVGLIREEGRYLIQQRPPKGLLAGLWEFPGGKKEKGESLEEALHREILEELGAEVEWESHLTTVHHSYTQFQVNLHAYECRLAGPLNIDKDSHRYASLKEMESLPVPSGTAKIIKYLEDREK